MKEIGLKCNIENSFFRKTKMESFGLWVKHSGVKPIDKNTSNKKYYATNLSKRSTTVYRFSELLLQYVGNNIAYVSAFKLKKIQ